MQKITTFLWFNDQAEEAINFYVSLFKNSKILSLSRNGDGGAGEFPGLSGVSRQNRSRLPGMRHAVGHIVPPPVLDGLPVHEPAGSPSADSWGFSPVS